MGLKVLLVEQRYNSTSAQVLLCYCEAGGKCKMDGVCTLPHCNLSSSALPLIISFSWTACWLPSAVTSLSVGNNNIKIKRIDFSVDARVRQL